MNKVVGFRRGTPVQIGLHINCDPTNYNYADKNLDPYDQRYSISGVGIPLRFISDNRFIIVTNQNPANTTLTVKQIDNDSIKMEVTTTHNLFLMDRFYLLVPTDTGFEVYDVTTNTKLYSNTDGFIFDEQLMQHCVKKFYDMHVMLVSNNTHYKILILSEDFKVFDEIIVPKANNQVTLYTAHWIGNILIFNDTLSGFNYYDIRGKNIFYRTRTNFAGWVSENVFMETLQEENKIMLSMVNLIRD